MNYYRSLIPKYIISQLPRYKPHISVVRNEKPPRLYLWKKHDGQEVEFEYDNEIKFDNKYVWLDVYSRQVELIRIELGLKRSRALNPDEGRFHITIGNFKDEKV